MMVFRLAKGLYKSDLSGRGAAISGGRWNSKGVELLYTADSRALCTTEIAVHTPFGLLPTDYFLLSIQLPDTLSHQTIDREVLPENWRMFPHPEFTKKIGDTFAKENKALVLKVPSAIVSGEFNYLINPRHADFNKIELANAEPFTFDDRLFFRNLS